MSDPEIKFGDKANVMLTASDSVGKKRPQGRFRRIRRMKKGLKVTR